MMKKYIATFYSQYGAMEYLEHLIKSGVEAKLAPTPRRVSASCGVCVVYEADACVVTDKFEIEAIYEEAGNAYRCIFEA